MDVMNAVLARRSIRKYSDIPIAKDVLVDILIAGQYAPHSGNAHTCRIFVIDEEGQKDQISDASFHQTWMKTAPIFFVICSHMERMEKMYGKRGTEVYVQQNASAMAENMILAATAHGLATCWVSAFHEDQIAHILGIPDFMKPQVVITCGYPDEKVPVPAKQDLTGLVYMNRFGGAGRYNNLDFLFKEYATVFQGHAKRAARSMEKTGKFVGHKLHEQLSDKIKEIRKKFEKQEKK